MSITTGLKGYAETVVSVQNTARTAGSGTLDVFATPMMVALMEQAAWTSLTPHLDEGDGTVGIQMSVSHDAATPLGMKVWAETEVTAVDGKRIEFAVTAYDEKGVIGKGTHQRFVITDARFMAKVQRKLEG